MRFKKTLLICLALETGTLILSVICLGFTLEALQTIVRFSGRLSLIVFSVIFLLRQNQIEKWLSEKPYHIFAIVHGIHLIELLAFVYMSGIKLIPYRLGTGFMAYAFIFSMPIIFNQVKLGKITPTKFQSIDTVFKLYIWIILLIFYIPRVLGKVPNAGGSHAAYIVLLSWVILMLIIKSISLLKFRNLSRRF